MDFHNKDTGFEQKTVDDTLKNVFLFQLPNRPIVSLRGMGAQEKRHKAVFSF